MLTDPSRHTDIDGSGMVLAARTSRPVRGVGDSFVMAMHNDEMGDYEMTSHAERWLESMTTSLERLETLTAAAHEP